VTVQSIDRGDHWHHRIETAGDLSPLLGWLDALDLKQIRIEPLGLRAVYDAVHSGVEETPIDHSGWEDEV
jgi:hypothetical protein